MSIEKPSVTALIVAHNEEDKIASCLEHLANADEIVVVLDKCTDSTKDITLKYTNKIVEGSWEVEGERRNAGLDACNGDWILEIDADEHVPDALWEEIRETIAKTKYDYHSIKFANWIGKKRMLYGFGASFTKGSTPSLFRKGMKRWDMQRVHPSSIWINKNQGYKLETRVEHYMDSSVSSTIKRLNSYTEARAKDLVLSGKVGSLANNIRRFFTRFFKCYVKRKGYREAEYGFLIALCAGLYPIVSYIKAKAMMHDSSVVENNK